MSSFVPYAAMSRTVAIPRARAEALTFEFAFRLEPIVQVTARLFSAFEIDFVGATSDFLNMRGVVHWDLSRLSWVEVP